MQRYRANVDHAFRVAGESLVACRTVLQSRTRSTWRIG